eukprot:TRINITY_DN19500_c0_g1_i1.p1 TRINITY_DN19500_c0_g1~~TRINITY_DN19500_c0_g1_i1.p1  ORF type:complete len:365 (+),score=77.98 TRINITY_DN19500_c0_g1_i1:72-1166(+)
MPGKVKVGKRKTAGRVDSDHAHIDVSQMSEMLQDVRRRVDPDRARRKLDSLHPSVAARVRALQALDEKSRDLRIEQRRELGKLEAAFAERCKHLFERRKQIAVGSACPSVEDARKGLDYMVKKQESDAPDLPCAPVEIGTPQACRVPDFWLTVLSNHPGFAEIIQPQDREPLSYLDDVESGFLGGDPLAGFWVCFRFRANPFFSDELVTKLYRYKSGDDADRAAAEEPVLAKVECSGIQWKDGRNVTVEMRESQQRKAGRRKKKGGGAKAVTCDAEQQAAAAERSDLVEVPVASFFNYFAPAGTDHEYSFSDEEDLQFAIAFAKQIIPGAVEWYCDELADHSDDDWEDVQDGHAHHRHQKCEHQ